MSKLYFRYAALNAGKSTALLQTAYNYEERGQAVDLFTAELDNRSGVGRIASRLGVSRSAQTFTADSDFETAYAGREVPACILVDEAQFLTPKQVVQLHRLANLRSVPVICYGLRTDFRGEPFPGSAALLSRADELEEMKTICRCGKKATMAIRFDDQGQRIRDGAQVMIGGNDRYESVCPRRFYTDQC